MTASTMAERLNPARFPNLSPQMAAGLSDVEWAAYAERVRERIGIDLEPPSPGESATSNGMKETDPLPR